MSDPVYCPVVGGCVKDPSCGRVVGATHVRVWIDYDKGSYSLFTHQVIFRNAGLDIVGRNLLYIIGVGSCFIIVALLRFRSMLSKQG